MLIVAAQTNVEHKNENRKLYSVYNVFHEEFVLVNSDSTRVLLYLMEKGYSIEDGKEIIKNAKNFDLISDCINKRYDAIIGDSIYPQMYTSLVDGKTRFSKEQELIPKIIARVRDIAKVLVKGEDVEIRESANGVSVSSISKKVIE